MVTATQYRYSDEQISAWLRGLLTIAWADGHFDPEEQDMIAQVTKDLEVSQENVFFQSITPQDLAEKLGQDEHTAENFLRTAVLVSLADGVYSSQEAEIILKFRDALGVKVEALEALQHTLCEVPQDTQETEYKRENLVSPPHAHPDVLHPMKDWLDEMDVQDPRVARFICKMVPPQCPFERDVKLFGHKIVHIPPLCKLNPLYEQLVGLRFRALSYLADDCKEDISEYI
ncbi:Mo-dependent nitrogenase C-terminal domain-containing protein [Chroococcus sp. FPU101]|uniref:Mo-dependent nitrogenase C-terminal domain-containing protein n=1 Tax=Chroococcus sp. FPU101 TaxID=1974212 RepID=UPI001A90B3D8|nr:Mo-dependent nitrogenase C-terminal domain-containing protein [Chroococcus sp. FPU101]GFE70131.1 Mo-dependent nitrogenase family protein [Chroococcus sp. FPU101]